GSNEGDYRYENRHGASATDGPLDLRRCRLRQDRSRDSRRIQSGYGRQTSRSARTDYRSRSATFRGVSTAHARLPGAERNAQPLPFAIRTEESIAAVTRRRRRYRYWHAPAHLRRCRFQRSRPGGNRRGAALWSSAQGEIERAV